MKRYVLAAILAVLSSVAPGSGVAGQPAAPDTRPVPVPVVASFSILGDLVTQVGGERVRVHVLVGPGQDAHVFQPRPSDATRLARARLVVINGLGFEGWLDRLIESVGYRGPVVVAAEGIDAHDMAASDDVHGHHDHDHKDHDHAGHDRTHGLRHGQGSVPDPHAWHDLRNVMTYVTNIASALGKVDPGNAAHYARNAQAYIARLTELDQWALQQMGSVAAQERKVIIAHESMQYFGHRYGVQFIAPQGMSTVSEPAAGEVAALIAQIRREKVRALFLESVTNPALLQQIAGEAGVRVQGRLYSDALSPPDGPAPDYLKMFRYNVESLRAAMQDD